MFGMIDRFLRGPEGFESEMHRRQGFSDESEASLRRELAALERQRREELNAEARSFRLAGRGAVSEQVFEEEIGLIHTKQRWIAEQRERVEEQLTELDQFRYDPASVELLRHRLDAKLSGASQEDRRFVLEAINAKVIVQTDKTWELELQIPREASEPTSDPLQVVKGRPESNSPVNTSDPRMLPAITKSSASA